MLSASSARRAAGDVRGALRRWRGVVGARSGSFELSRTHSRIEEVKDDQRPASRLANSPAATPFSPSTTSLIRFV